MVLKNNEIPSPLADHIVRELRATGFRRLLVGLSGGADSICLLSLLTSVPLPRVEIKAVHCNFMLRGEESLRDEEFCRKICSEFGIGLQVVRFDTREEARRRKVSLEVACRDLRYALFRSLMAAEGWERVVVAHHADDNAETLLLNLMRGSGIKGLKGMVADSGEIWRPLLPFSRREILDYLEAKGIPHIEDSTNADSDFNRNFLRNKVLPLLETRWPHARRMIARSAALLAREESLLAQSLALPSPEEPLSLERISSCPEPETLVYHYIRRRGGTPGIAAEIWKSIRSEERVSGKMWNIPSGGRIYLERDGLDILPSDPIPLLTLEEETLSLSEDVWNRILTSDASEAWLPRPLDKYVIRRMREGDRIRKGGLGGSALVSKLMKDAGYSRRQKEQTPIVENPSTGEIVWVAGLRRAAVDLVSPHAAEAYRVRVAETVQTPSPPPPPQGGASNQPINQ